MAMIANEFGQPVPAGYGPFLHERYDIQQDNLANTAYQQTNNPTWSSNSTVKINPTTGDWQSYPKPSSGGGSKSPTGESARKAKEAADRAKAEAQKREIERQLMAEIDKSYGAKMGFLNKAESRLKSDLPTVEGDVNSLIGESQNTLNTQRGVSEQQLSQQQAEGGVRKEDALTAAVRLYNELITGGQQRFGGASSAGEAYQALSGRELQRNQQGINQNYEQFTQQIEGARQNVQAQYTTAMQNLDSQKTRMLSEVRRDFQNKLLEIDRLKSEAAGDKANKRLAALQDMRNQIYQINLAVAQGTDQVEQYSQQLLSQIDQQSQAFGQSTQQGQGATSDYLGSTPTSFDTSLTMGGNQGTTSNPFIQGAIRPQMSRREDLFGNLFA